MTLRQFEGLLLNIGVIRTQATGKESPQLDLWLKKLDNANAPPRLFPT